MSAELDLAQANVAIANLIQEVQRFRDSAMGFNSIYPTVTEGREGVGDGKYFSVPGEGAYMRLYRRQGSSAELIAEFESRESMLTTINDAVADAEARANAAADRAEVHADSAGYVTRERFKQRSTLGLDFAAGRYWRDNGQRTETRVISEALDVTRTAPSWELGPNGLLREVPTDVLARKWSGGRCVGARFNTASTNQLLNSRDPSKWNYNAATLAETDTKLGEPFGRIVPDSGTGGSSTSGGPRFMQSGYSEGDRFSFSVCLASAGVNTVRVRRSSATQSHLTLAIIDLTTGTLVEAADHTVRLTQEGGGVFRLEGMAAAGTDGSAGYWIVANDPAEADGTAGFWVGMPQQELGYPTAYIPTLDAPATRDAESVIVSNDGLINLQRGTYLLDFVMHGLSPNVGILESSGFWSVRTADSGDDRFALRLRTPGSPVNTVSILGGPHKLGERLLMAVSYDGKSAIACVNGGVVVPAEGALVPSSVSTTRILGRSSASNSENGEVALFAYSPERLTEAELQELTTL
ncbi:phage head spike fiber domain-containing protein [Vreelandella glaciei]|uniref:phage head spike fiber domain-containing protein n=1 Tax=Vreelandella glaciei TaxID=186761 RepID=UPI0030ED3861